jgi:hypothetical protein
MRGGGGEKVKIWEQEISFASFSVLWVVEKGFRNFVSNFKGCGLRYFFK